MFGFKNYIIRALAFVTAVFISLSAASIDLTVYASAKVSPPKSIKVSFVSTGVKIKWSKVKSAKGYYIYRKKSTSTKFTRIAKITKKSQLTYVDKNAQSGNYYIYAVKSYKGSNTSAYKKATKKYYVKAPIISSLKNNYTSITVKWKKIKGVTGYRLYRKTGSGSWKKIATFKGDSKVKYTDNNVTDGKKYTYSLKAYKGSKNSVRGTTEKLKFKKTVIKVTLNKTKLKLSYGKTYNLVAIPSIKDVSVKWKSSNSNIVSVNAKGKIKAVSEGAADITAYFTYDKKKYKNVCKVTVTEKEYNVGDTVNFDGKLSFKIDSVISHNECESASSTYGTDKIIISYSYKNICCGKKLKIDADDFSVSDQKGISGKFVDDCPYYIEPESCSDGVSEDKAVAVAGLKSKGDYCYLRLTVNISDYGKVTAKFKLKIDRSKEVFLSEGKALTLLGAAANVTKVMISNKSSFKLIDAAYTLEDNFEINGQRITSPTCSLKYEYVSASGKTEVKSIKIWFDDNIYNSENCKYYYVDGKRFIIIPINTFPSVYDGKIYCESIANVIGKYKVTEIEQ